MDLSDRVLGCLLGGAVGDALGYAVEFDGIETIRGRYGPRGITRPTVQEDGLAHVSDDTQMMLFTLEGLILARRAGREDPVGEVRHAYQRWLHTQGTEWTTAAGEFLATHPEPIGGLVREPRLFNRRAPGNTVVMALVGFASRGERGSVATPVNDSKGCGGVMRAAPVALWSDAPATTFDLAAETAAITHGHPSGYLSAAVLATIVRCLFAGQDLPRAVTVARSLLIRRNGHEEQLRLLNRAMSLAEERPGPERIAEELGGGWVGEEALAIGLCAVAAADDLAEALAIAANHTGDSDSTAMIAGNIAGARDGTAAIPAEWLNVLELRELIEEYGRDAAALFRPTAAEVEVTLMSPVPERTSTAPEAPSDPDRTPATPPDTDRTTAVRSGPDRTEVSSVAVRTVCAGPPEAAGGRQPVDPVNREFVTWADRCHLVTGSGPGVVRVAGGEELPTHAPESRFTLTTMLAQPHGAPTPVPEGTTPRGAGLFQLRVEMVSDTERYLAFPAPAASGLSTPQPVELASIELALVNEVVATAPEGWRQVDLAVWATATRTELTSTVVTSTGARPWSVSPMVTQWVRRHRLVSYRPATGAWFRALFRLRPAGPPLITVEHTEVPRFVSTGPRELAAECYWERRLLPRTPQACPVWLTEQAMAHYTRHRTPVGRTGRRTARVFDVDGIVPTVYRPVLTDWERDRVLAYLTPTMDPSTTGGGLTVPGGTVDDRSWVIPASVAHHLREHGIPPAPDLLDHLRAVHFVPLDGNDAER